MVVMRFNNKVPLKCKQRKDDGGKRNLEKKFSRVPDLFERKLEFAKYIC